MTDLYLWRTCDGAYVIRASDHPTVQELAELRPDGSGWWAARRLSDGVQRTMWQPHTQATEENAARTVAERLLR
ncbi:hypothetical protein [Actinomadura sp. NBRC 104425]|uniref:hypothetical protein n=1 Tax=Actinomadura sp. NBRC 104425 TaxID=3032204 RepID=UPI002556C722|nr:hypothetical protein [Actinomadura sp. NBRC 104425]